MGSEDFSFIMHTRYRAYLGFWELRMTRLFILLHSNHFNLDDGNLYKGAGLYAQFALNYLQQVKGDDAHV
jgi:metal-dependent amidase/aminoacylase/carboxypeptidase family protein